jgi:lysophospholipase L1-like esterase
MDLEKRRVGVWGDSILKGVFYDEEAGRYRIASPSGTERFAAATGATVANHARFGLTAGRALERVEAALAKEPPERDDIVLLEFGGNDCDFRWDEVAADPAAPHLPRTPIENFGAALQALVDAFKAKRIAPALMTLPPIDPLKYFAWITRALDPGRVLAWLGDVNRIYRWQEAYNDIVVEVAAANSLRLVDVRRAFLVGPDFAGQLCADGIHPSPRGQATLLEAALDYVRGL